MHAGTMKLFSRLGVRSYLQSIRHKSGGTSSQLAVFDRTLKRRQREFSFSLADSAYFDYLRKESASRLVDRLEDISRSFPMALDLGCHRGHIFELVNEREALGGGKGGIGGIETLVQCDMGANVIASMQEKENEKKQQVEAARVKTMNIACDEEALPFKEHTFDLVVSNMALHWVNDLPSTLQQVKSALKPDGAFVASLLGGSTLQELRQCFYLAEQERRGGFSPHASPFVLASDAASLMQAAGFSLPTIDVDTVTISYPDAFTLMEHLGCMGEGTASLNRQYNVGKDTFLAMASLYQEQYGLEDGSVPATFQLIYVIGWAPDASQPKACKRGSATQSLRSLERPAAPDAGK